MNHADKKIKDILVLLSAAILLIGACVEFFHVASGTGNAIGEFSPTWLILFFVFVVFNFALFILAIFWQRGLLSAVSMKLVLYRNKLSLLRWIFAILILCLLYTSPSPRDRTRSRMPSSA